MNTEYAIHNSILISEFVNWFMNIDVSDVLSEHTPLQYVYLYIYNTIYIGASVQYGGGGPGGSQCVNITVNIIILFCLHLHHVCF